MRGKGFAVGVVTGALVGAAMGIMMDPIPERHKRMVKKRTTRAMRAIGGVLSEVMERGGF